MAPRKTISARAALTPSAAPKEAPGSEQHRSPDHGPQGRSADGSRPRHLRDLRRTPIFGQPAEHAAVTRGPPTLAGHDDIMSTVRYDRRGRPPSQPLAMQYPQHSVHALQPRSPSQATDPDITTLHRQPQTDDGHT